MNWQAFADPSFSVRLCLTLLHSLWQVALLALIARGADWLGRRRSLQTSYAIHVAALIVGLVAVPVTYTFVDAGREKQIGQVVQPAGPAPSAESRNASKVQPVEHREQAASKGPFVATFAPKPVQPAEPAAEASRSVWLQLAPWLAALYAAGVVVMLVRLAIGLWSAHRLAASGELLGDGPLTDMLHALAEKWSMRVAPALARAERIAVPKVVGLVRPMILLPAAAISGLSIGELEMVLAHELAHIRRHDMWIKLLERLAEAVLFFNPALWYLSRRISTLREFCCDELTCGAFDNSDAAARTRYASALVRVVELSLRAHPSFPARDLAALAASGRSPSELRRRIAHLLGEPLREPLRLTRGGLLTIAVVTVLLLIGPVTWRSSANVASAEPGKEQAAKPTAPAAAKAEDPKNDGEYTFPITVFGHAVDVTGKPIAAAEIYLAAQRPGYRRLAETKAAADGSYRFEKVLLPIQRADTNAAKDSGDFEVFGIAEGHALAWRPRKSFYPDSKHMLVHSIDPKQEPTSAYGAEDPIELDLTFGPAVSIRGKIVDDLGQAIPNAKIELRYCDTEWDKADYDGSRFFGSLDSLNGQATVPPRIKKRLTDADGRFEFNGLPADYRWSIDVRPPGHPPRTIWAVTRDGIAADAKGKRVYSGDFELQFAKPRPTKLRVVYADTGEPAPKVGVSGGITEAGFFETTDEAGIVETALPDGHYKVSITPRYGSPYLRTEAELVVSSDAVKETPTFRLRPAAVVDVTVVDADTGKPLAGVDVSLNGSVHGYRSWEVETNISHYESPRSDKNGKMRVLFEPGRHRIGVGREAYPQGYVPVDPGGKEIDCQPGKPIAVEFAMQNTAAQEESADEPKPDTGSDLLRNIRRASAPLLAEMAEKHGYSLAAGQSLHRVAPPFPEIRMTYYRTGHPSQSEAIPRGPSGMVFRWDGKELQNWGMTFGQEDDPGYTLLGVLDAVQGIMSQQVEGPKELLETRLPGDWVVRPGAKDEVVVRELEKIAREELKLPVHLEFRQVQRDVYVARGRYKLTPLPGQPAEDKLFLTDETLTTDPVQIFAEVIVPDSGAGGGTGEYAEFLLWLGRWIEMPIVDEAVERPKRQISWRLNERSPSTAVMRQEDHDAERVLKNITAQTGLTFSKEKRSIKLLFVENKE